MTDDEILNDIAGRLQHRLQEDGILWDPSEEGPRFGPFPARETDEPGVYEVTVPVTAEQAERLGLDPTKLLPWADPARDVLRDISYSIEEDTTDDS